MKIFIGFILPMLLTFLACYCYDKNKPKEEFSIVINDDLSNLENINLKITTEEGTMKPAELKEKRDSFGFTQKQMADILGIHPNALQRMEYGSSPIPKYIRNYALSLTALNENTLIKKHIKLIGVEPWWET